MLLSEYQKEAGALAIYPRDKNILYPALGIVNECGEVAGKIKKIFRDDDGVLTVKRKTAITKELGDCCWYLAAICKDTELDLQMLYDMRSANDIHKIRDMDLPRLSISMISWASALANELEKWYYDYQGRLQESGRFFSIAAFITQILIRIAEIAKTCDTTLEEVYIANMENLLGRKKRGTLKGEGDNR